AERLTMLLSGADSAASRHALQASRYNVKVAVVMLRRGFDRRRAEKVLRDAGGNLRSLLGSLKNRA
ncbi:MAG: hypothetical protein M3007_01350, partial [Candidatus Eremiobacteraeota bacterium]|nr:hypothetical protein [Candidatus Eremiobacteraeota bacterium]